MRTESIIVLTTLHHRAKHAHHALGVAVDTAASLAYAQGRATSLCAPPTMPPAMAMQLICLAGTCGPRATSCVCCTFTTLHHSAKHAHHALGVSSTPTTPSERLSMPLHRLHTQEGRAPAHLYVNVCVCETE